jgi:hypothetical protein
MKKIYILLAIVLLAPFAIVSAEGTKATTSPSSVKPALMRLEDRIKKVENKVDVKKAGADAKVKKIEEKASTTKDRIENKIDKVDKKIEVKKEANKVKAVELAKRAERKINAAITRLEVLSGRISDRLNILADKGVVKPEAKTTVTAILTDANNLIGDARAFSATIGTETDKALASSTPKEAFKSAQEIGKSAEDKAKAAHAKLVDALTAMKASIEKETKNATTTAQ